MRTRYPVVLLPGGVLPAEPAYASLLQVLGDRVDAVAKGPRGSMRGTDRPRTASAPIAGIVREADAHGFDRFHLLGYRIEPEHVADSLLALWERADS